MPGIPLSDDFKDAYTAIADQSSLPGVASGRKRPFAKEFTFQASDSVGFFHPKKLSPDIGHVGTRLGFNFRSKNYLAKDKQARDFETHARSGLRLTAYLGSLISLRVRSRELQVSDSDGLVLDEILLSLTGSLWEQLSAAAVQATNVRRETALSSLGVLARDIPSLLVGVPQTGEHLFGGQFAAVLQREIDSRKQAADLTKHFAPPQPAKPPKPKAKAPPAPVSRRQQVSSAPPRSAVSSGQYSSSARGVTAPRGRGSSRSRGKAPAKPKQAF